jgi:hypothetical protein
VELSGFGDHVANPHEVVRVSVQGEEPLDVGPVTLAPRRVG